MNVRTEGRLPRQVEETARAAVQVLVRNAAGRRAGLPRTAGWGYPEPYTRDLMISSLGMLTCGEEGFKDTVRRVLAALAANQTPLGHVPSMADEPEERGMTDCTPLFLIGLAAYRRVAGKRGFLEDAAARALRWMEYQSPTDRVIVAQQPTSDWRDEQWVPGYGLYVNTLVYTALRLWGKQKRADQLKKEMNRPAIERGFTRKREREGLSLGGAPYYALFSYKVHSSRRFDLLGNSLAVLAGIGSRNKARSLTAWVEAECRTMREAGVLRCDLPPCLFPFIQPSDSDWHPRYEQYNLPGEYHNGGVWPFVCGFYVAALVAAGRQRLARRKLAALADILRPSVRPGLEYGFNEWFRAQDGSPLGQDWQTWSAAMYLYAATCVEQGSTPLFDEVRKRSGLSW